MIRERQQSPLTVDDFDYDLPGELVAQHPAPERTASRLLRLSRAGVSDHAFSDLPQFLSAGDVLVFNDTRVVKARLVGVKETGGRIEVLIERVLGANEALAQMRASHPPPPGGSSHSAYRVGHTRWEPPADGWDARPGRRSYIRSIMALPKPEQDTWVEPGIRRAKS